MKASDPVTTPAPAEAAQARPPRATAQAGGDNPLVGTWRLVSYTREVLATGERMDLLGANPEGLLTYTRGGHVSAIIARDGRRPPTGLVATEAEKVELYDGLVAYAGTYTVEGDRVTHRIEVSWNQSWTGTAVVRTFAVEGNRVRLQTAPSPGPFGGREGIGVLIWQRVE